MKLADTLKVVESRIHSQNAQNCAQLAPTLGQASPPFGCYKMCKYFLVQVILQFMP